MPVSVHIGFEDVTQKQWHVGICNLLDLGDCIVKSRGYNSLVKNMQSLETIH